MRDLWYLLSSLSCGVLAAVFYARNELPLAILVACISLFYLYKVFVLGGRERKREMLKLSQTPPLNDRKKEELRQELLDTRSGLIRRRNAFFFILAGILSAAGFALSRNPALAAAILLFLPPALYLLCRNIKAINLIERGLGLKRNGP